MPEDQPAGNRTIPICAISVSVYNPAYRGPAGRSRLCHAGALKTIVDSDGGGAICRVPLLTFAPLPMIPVSCKSPHSGTVTFSASRG